MVRVRRRMTSAIRLLAVIIKTAAFRRRRTAALLSATSIILVITVGKWLLWPAQPRYAVFGVDRHPSVMRLLESDVVVSRLNIDEDDEEEDSVEKLLETVGVFVVLSPASTSDDVVPRRLETVSELHCLSFYHYEIFVVSSAATSLDRKQYGDEEVTSAARQLGRECVQEGPMSVVVWLVRVSGDVGPSIVANLITEAYVDNITWYDVIFLPQMTRSLPMWERWPPAELGRPSHVGTAVKIDDDAIRIAFYRTHLDIFGNSWPPGTRTAADVAKYLREIYYGVSTQSTTFNTAVQGDQLWFQRYLKAMKSGPPQPCSDCHFEFTAARSKVISMSLYGDDPRYTIGALRNAQRLPVVFPGWRLRFYYRSGDVLRQLVDRLRELGAEMNDVTMMSDVGGLSPMLWRISALDDPSVDVLLCRDADSRLMDRDAEHIAAWLSAHRRPAFHCIRDHPSHAAFSVNGGLWAARRRRLVNLVGGRPLTPLLAAFGDQYMDDMRFLDEHVWEWLSTVTPHEILCHDSVSCDRWVGAQPFITPRRWPAEHVGQVFDASSQPRQIDIDLLLSANRSVVCDPETQSSLVTVEGQTSPLSVFTELKVH